MDEVILKLLKQNGRVIIPDFGALIVKQKTPFTVIFNEFLQYNDGALVGAIQNSLNVERDVAADKAKALAKELQDKLGRGEDVVLNDIGVLTKSSTGKISLGDLSATAAAQPDKKPEPMTEEPAETVEFDLDEDKKEEDKKEVEAESKPEEDLPPKAPKPETPVKKEEERKETIKPPVARPTVKPESKPATKNQVPEETPPPITEYYGEKGGKKKLNIILWVTIIVIVNGAIIGFFLFNDEIRGVLKSKDNKVEVEMTPQDEPEPEVSETAIEDSIVAAPTSELVIEETAEEPEDVQPEQKALTGTKYYVVAGVFQNESNADKLVQTLKTKGYSNAEKFTKIGQMYAVSYDVFPAKGEADALMLKIQKNENSGAWIKVIK